MVVTYLSSSAHPSVTHISDSAHLALTPPTASDVSLSPHTTRTDCRATPRHRETGSDVIAVQVNPGIYRRSAADNIAPVLISNVINNREAVIYTGCGKKSNPLSYFSNF